MKDENTEVERLNRIIEGLKDKIEVLEFDHKIEVVGLEAQIKYLLGALGGKN